MIPGTGPLTADEIPTFGQHRVAMGARLARLRMENVNPYSPWQGRLADKIASTEACIAELDALLEQVIDR